MPRCSDTNPYRARERSQYDLACRLVMLGYDVREIAERRSAPRLPVLLRWLAEKSEFRDRYHDAHGARMERLARSIIALADDRRSHPRDRKLSLETRKWLIARMEKKAQKEAPAREAEKAKQSQREEIAQRLREAGERIKRYNEQLRQEAEREAVAPARGEPTGCPATREDSARQEPPAPKPEPAPSGDGSWSIWYGPMGEGVADATAGPPPSGWWR